MDSPETPMQSDSHTPIQPWLVNGLEYFRIGWILGFLRHSDLFIPNLSHPQARSLLVGAVRALDQKLNKTSKKRLSEIIGSAEAVVIEQVMLQGPPDSVKRAGAMLHDKLTAFLLLNGPPGLMSWPEWGTILNFSSLHFRAAANEVQTGGVADIGDYETMFAKLVSRIKADPMLVRLCSPLRPIIDKMVELTLLSPGFAKFDGLSKMIVAFGAAVDSEETAAANKCPNCSAERRPGATECPKCSIVYEKFLRRQSASLPGGQGGA